MGHLFVGGRSFPPKKRTPSPSSVLISPQSTNGRAAIKQLRIACGLVHQQAIKLKNWVWSTLRSRRLAASGNGSGASQPSSRNQPLGRR